MLVMISNKKKSKLQTGWPSTLSCLMTIFPTDVSLGNRDNEEKTKLKTYIHIYTAFTIWSGIYWQATYLFKCSAFDSSASKYDNARSDWLNESGRYITEDVQESGRGHVYSGTEITTKSLRQDNSCPGWDSNRGHSDYDPKVIAWASLLDVIKSNRVVTGGRISVRRFFWECLSWFFGIL
jgi:hypothetical protein